MLRRRPIVSRADVAAVIDQESIERQAALVMHNGVRPDTVYRLRRKAPSTPATMSKQRSTLSKESFDLSHSTAVASTLLLVWTGLNSHGRLTDQLSVQMPKVNTQRCTLLTQLTRHYPLRRHSR